MQKLHIKSDNSFISEATLNDSKTSQQLLQELPVSGTASVWGKEIYFPVALDVALDKDAQMEVEPGTLAYWPDGQVLCLFFGPTPISDGDKPKGIAEVNIIGTIEDITPLHDIKAGSPIKLLSAKAERFGFV